ncbi:hypothetical protein [Pedobacter aquatilis]|uniref:hypothetical protein n=1 Tax=Pedobacter aquatilis TaxID=351343 RepID=UPI00292D856F|nr:hypothetical protein [Pedobacter aquatilis]
MIRNLCFLFYIIVLCSSCDFASDQTNPRLRDYSWESVKGIRYQEVRRRFKDGLSFNQEGFMQKPSWIIEVAAEDTMMAWSPQKKIMQKFFLQYDHGNMYNFAEEWFKVKSMTADSLVLQRVQVNGKLVIADFRSDVNMTFYAQRYIKNKLKTTAEKLQRPTRLDTAFINKRAAQVNSNTDSAFAATEPVQFIPKSKIVSVEKLVTANKLEGRTVSYDYMFPQYKIIIDRAYKDFAYQISAVVDFQGGIHVKDVYGVLPGTVEAKKKNMQAVSDIYLRNLFNVLPGTTLGIPHNSRITIMVVGKAIKKP